MGIGERGFAITCGSQIFVAFFKMALSPSEGHAMVSSHTKRVVDEKGWIEGRDFIDILAGSDCSQPGSC